MFRTALKAGLEDRHSETEAMNLFSDDDIRTPDTTLALKSPQPRQMEVPGRVDGEGKTRSHRTEAPEIEDCLRLHRSVDNAAVITLEREGSEEAELLGMDVDQLGEFAYDYVEVRRDYLAWTPAKGEVADKEHQIPQGERHGIHQHSEMLEGKEPSESGGSGEPSTGDRHGVAYEKVEREG